MVALSGIRYSFFIFYPGSGNLTRSILKYFIAAYYGSAYIGWPNQDKHFENL